MNKNIIVVRKELSDHSSYEILSNGPLNKYLFVDDLISSGNTAKTVIKKIAAYYPNSACVGGYLYSSMEVISWEYMRERLSI